MPENAISARSIVAEAFKAAGTGTFIRADLKKAIQDVVGKEGENWESYSDDLWDASILRPQQVAEAIKKAKGKLQWGREQEEWDAHEDQEEGMYFHATVRYPATITLTRQVKIDWSKPFQMAIKKTRDPEVQQLATDKNVLKELAKIVEESVTDAMGYSEVSSVFHALSGGLQDRGWELGKIKIETDTTEYDDEEGNETEVPEGPDVRVKLDYEAGEPVIKSLKADARLVSFEVEVVYHARYYDLFFPWDYGYDRI